MSAMFFEVLDFGCYSVSKCLYKSHSANINKMLPFGGLCKGVMNISFSLHSPYEIHPTILHYNVSILGFV